ncbi:BppU family phage baseplate upper protein [Bacillus inaquosorum]|uniref:phage baseplate upper protein n=1 Tax=Bacillus inaquosorum TaxID=483913 RepID=UPI00227E5BBD|nr:BppU family phage baseplate upper protein [Bacillus inaquosorum]MCY9083722.1 BppU family phage baseplate upper protein [Bacillus inaquosorum]
MVYKDAEISALVTTNLGDYKTTNIRFSTQDVGTAKLSFYLFKDGVPLPLSAVTAKIVMAMADGSRFVKDVTIVDKLAGQAEYVLTSDEIKHYGPVKASLNLYYHNEQSLAVVRFTFEIMQDLIDYNIAPTAEYYIEQFEDLKDSVETIVEELQEKFSNLDNVETKAGAQAKADAVQANLDTHAGNKSNPHAVTKTQVGLGNVSNDKQATKTEFDLHVDDEIKHITNTERLNWNASQGKVDSHVARTDNPHGVTKAQVGLDKVDNVQQASKTEFNTHNADSIRHVAQADKDKWNGSQIYKITSDDGQHLLGMASKDLFTELASKRTTTFYSNSTTTNQPPVTSSFRGFQIGQDNIGEVLAMGNDGSTWRVTNSNGWKTWRRLITNEDFEAVTWQNVTLKNGAAASERTFQYAKWGNLLLLRGHITATREVVCGSIPSDRVPTNGAVVMIPVSGTSGYSKLILFANGDLKLSGLHSNNDSAVTGYYMDTVIPLN